MRAMVTHGLLIVVVCLGVADGSAHAAGWAPAMPIGVGDRAFIEADLTPAGAATVLWRGVANGQPAILASARPPGGAFTAPVPVSTQASDVRAPSLAVSRNGIAVAAWAQRATPTGNWVVQVAVRASGGEWSAPEPLEGGGSDPEPHVAISDDDEALVIWKTAEVVRQGRVHVSSRPRGGAWSWPDMLAYPEAAEPQIVVDPRGNATALWLSASGGATPSMVLTRHRPAGGAWSALSVLGDDLGSAKYPHLAVGADGTAGAVWQEAGVPRAAIRPPGGAWGDPEPLGFHPGSYPEERLGIAVDGAGTATSVGGAGLWGVQTNRRPAAGAWTAAPETLQEPYVTERYYPTVVTNPRGFTLIGFLGYKDHHPDTGDPVTQAAIRHPGAAWSPAITIGEPGGLVAADVDDGTNGLVVWTAPTGVVYGRAYDSAGPHVEPVAPTGAVAGQPAPFAVTVRDDWSAPGATSWDFGDGSTATGDRPSHTYAAPGRYTVRVTGRDAVGNATSAERVVEVAPAPPSLAVASARFVRAGFQRSRLDERARVLVEGTISAQVPVSLELTGPLRPKAGRRTFALGVRRLGAGTFAERFRMPKALVARMLPGSYELRFTGPGLAPVTSRLELRAPPGGVVMARRIGTSRTGPNLLRVTATTRLWATFTFAPDGAARRRLRARWYAPDSDKPVGSFPVKRAFSYWQNPRGLAKGRWRCVLVARGRVVDSVSIRVG